MPSTIGEVRSKKKNGLIDAITTTAGVLQTGLSAYKTGSDFLDGFDTAKQFAKEADKVSPIDLPAKEVIQSDTGGDVTSAFMRRGKQLLQRRNA